MKIVNAFIVLAAVTAVVPASALAGNDRPAMPENQQTNPVMMQGQPVMMTPEMMQQMMRQQMMQQRRQMMQGQPGMMNPQMMQHRQMMMQGQPGQQGMEGMQDTEDMQGMQGMQGQPGMMYPGMMHAGKGCGMMKPEMMAKKQAHRKAMETHLANIEALLRQLVEQQKSK